MTPENINVIYIESMRVLIQYLADFMDKFDTTGNNERALKEAGISLIEREHMAKIYKYLGPNIAEVLKFSDGTLEDWSHFGIKMSTLDQYNDPFERFLTIDFSTLRPDTIAYYENIISMYKDLLVTCFSKRPDIVPMWAHYANNMSGFVLEINETRLLEYFSSSSKKITGLRDIEYMDKPNPAIRDSLMRAAGTLKPRHLHWFTQALMISMYFYKQSCWQYEEEKRLIIADDLAYDISGIKLIPIPFNCLDSIIVGENTPIETKKILLDIAHQYKIDLHEMHIGKSYPLPYFISTEKKTLVFDGKELAPTQGCKLCSEAIQAGAVTCPWCSITDMDKHVAHNMNSFRILDSAGILGRTLEGYRAIDERYSKK